ncbi:siderophore-interacting protein [Tistrella mobilis]|uniref:siderophore-interacting protein n=1 Tax=Tistrella mobilis TaxID=171437 RepID=UPI003555C0FF
MTDTPDDGYRLLRVTAITDPGPHLRRLRLEGPDLARFATDDDLHVRLWLPDEAGGPPPRPMLGPDGRPLGAARGMAGAMRYYTIRRIDPSAGWLEVDFVLHEASGPGADFARRAVPGAACGMSGPCGRGVSSARRYLLGGDETALPAIARIAEGLGADTTGLALIEVDGPEDVLPFDHPPGLAVSWIFRRDGGRDPLAAALGPLLPGFGGADDFVWIAGEFDQLQTLKPRLAALPRSRQLCVPYWRRSETRS